MNRFLIANAQQCIGCRTCEVACAVAHQQAQDVSIRHSAPDLGINLPIALTQYLQNDLLVSC